MEPPLTCDRCGATVLSDDESGSATVITAGDALDDAGYFVAVREATVEDGHILIDEADVYCEEHMPDTAYEYDG